jgi:hypothetical protein
MPLLFELLCGLYGAIHKYDISSVIYTFNCRAPLSRSWVRLGYLFFLLDSLYYDVKCWALFSESGVYKANYVNLGCLYRVYHVTYTYVRHLIS